MLNVVEFEPDALGLGAAEIIGLHDGQLHTTQHSGQDVVEVVCDPAGQGSQGLHLLRLEQLSLQAVALRLGLFVFRDVDQYTHRYPGPLLVGQTHEGGASPRHEPVN